MKQRKPMRKVSKRRAVENREYAKKRKAFLEMFPVCQVCKVMPATQIHHRAKRCGKLFLDEKLWLALDSTCHRMVEDNPEWARKMGYSLDKFTV